MTRAAIAIGSNSTRLLALRDSGEALRARADTRLMLGLKEDGALSEEAMRYTAEAVRGLKAQAEAFGAERVSLYATSATRDAKNAEAFREQLMRTAGLELNVLPGEEEARLAFLAASRGRECAVLDIGGGSTELSFGRNNAVYGLMSAQAGASRMYKLRPINSMEDAEWVMRCAAEVLESTGKALLSKPRPELLIGIGGTCSTAAAIKLKVDRHDEAIEGAVITLEDARAQLAMLAPMPPESRALVKGLYPSRKLIMPHGLCILIAAMTLFRYDALTVSIRNNLDALIDAERHSDI